MNPRSQLQSRIVSDFGYHKPPTSDEGERLDRMRASFLQLAEYLADSVPEGRELSLALTHLEQAQFFANAGVSRQWPLVQRG